MWYVNVSCRFDNQSLPRIPLTWCVATKHAIQPPNGSIVEAQLLINAEIACLRKVIPPG